MNNSDNFSDYEFTPDYNSETEQINIDEMINNLVVNVTQFNKLPDSHKIGEPFDNIIKLKKECEKQLTELRTTLDNCNKINVNDTTFTFDNCLKKLNDIEQLKLDKMTLHDKLNVYTELCKIKTFVKETFSQKRMKILELKN